MNLNKILWDELNLLFENLYSLFISQVEMVQINNNAQR